MQIQVNTDDNITGGGVLTRDVESVVEGSLGRFGDRITRVEVQLTDESSSHKSAGNDKRCKMEARLAGLQPIVVTDDSASLEQAISGAATKLEKLLDRTLGRLDARKGGTSYAGDPEA